MSITDKTVHTKWNLLNRASADLEILLTWLRPSGLGLIASVRAGTLKLWRRAAGTASIAGRKRAVIVEDESEAEGRGPGELVERIR